MRLRSTAVRLLALCLSSLPLAAQAIIAQTSGLTNPQHVIDFGANLFPNFTPVSTQFTGITLTHARYFTTGTSNNLVGGFLTNDPIGNPNTLRVQFAQPVRSMSFVYHQVGTFAPSVFRFLLAGNVVGTFTNSSNQTQTNNYFGWQNLVCDELQLDFVADFNFDTLAYDDASTASCTVRNGTGVNPSEYAFTNTPVLGANWQSTIAMHANSLLAWQVWSAGGPQAPSPFLGGELLIQVAGGVFTIAGSGSYSVSIPNGAQWLGTRLSTQGLRMDTVGATPTLVPLNAIDLFLGH